MREPRRTAQPDRDTATPAPVTEGDRSSPDRRGLEALVILVIVVVFVAHALFVASGAVVDDAYIAFRYSRNLAAGEGLRFQPGPPVEGYTCFSWVVLGALFARLGMEPRRTGRPPATSPRR